MFTNYLTAIPTGIEVKTWMMGGAMVLGRAREQCRNAPPDATAEETRAVQDRILENMARAVLPEHARQALRLRFQEHHTFREIAAELDVSAFYAESLVSKSLAILRNVPPAPPGAQKEE